MEEIKAEKVVLMLMEPASDKCGEIWEDPVIDTFAALVKTTSGKILRANAVIWFDVDESKPRLDIYVDDYCTEMPVDVEHASIRTIAYAVSEDEIAEIIDSLLS